MSYKENEVVAKFTKGNHQSDCKKYTTDDLLDMFDETEITIDGLGNTDGVTVNECITHVDLDAVALVTKDLVVTSECDDMFVYLNNDNTDVMGSFDENGDAVDYNKIEVACSASLDYEFQNQSE